MALAVTPSKTSLLPNCSAVHVLPAEPAAVSGWPTTRVAVAAVLCWSAVTLFALHFGPLLGDHEVIVAQSARQAIQSGHSLVPIYLDVPFLVKPPLAAWLVELTSMVLPDAAVGLPVTAMTARLPSALATLLTAWLLYVLGRSMFSKSAAWLGAFVYCTAVGPLLFAVNATAEALLTLFCTWAYAEFWWSRQTAAPAGRRFHLLRFYVALGLGMLAKGPMPLMLVAAPIAVWWWLDRPARLVACGGLGSAGRAARLLAQQAWPQLRRALTRLGLWWGVPVFLLMFLPWMFLVARRYPYAWQLWRYEYLDRLEGNYPGCHLGEYHYYLPIFFGMLLPWCLSLPEALLSPFLNAYRLYRRPLVYVWCWVLVGLLLLSVMTFKKSYYILPAAPGCALLLGPVLHRLFFTRDRFSARHHVWIVGLIVASLVGFLAFGWFFGRHIYPEIWEGPIAWTSPLFGLAVVLTSAAAGILFVRGRRRRSVWLLGGASLIVFALIWCTHGGAIGNAEDPAVLVRKLEEAGLPPDAELYWASNRPDGRVPFYGHRTVRHVLDPYKLIAEQADRRDADQMRLAVAHRICELLEGPASVYVVFQRGQFQMLLGLFHPPARELFSVDRGPLGPDEDDWVVVTNVSPRT